MLNSLTSILYFQVTEVFTYKRLIRCQTEFPSPSLDFRKWLTLATFLTQYLVPLLLTFVVYTFVSKRIWWRIKIGSSTQNQLIFHLETKKRTVKMLVYVVVLFAVCWLPLNMYHLIIEFSSYVGPMRHSTTTYYLCHWLAMSNVCYNPFIYCWLNDHFRSGAKSCVVIIIKKVFCFNINVNSHVNSNKGVVRYTSSIYKDSSTASSSSAPGRSGITQRNIQDLETRNPTSKEDCDSTNMSSDVIQLEEINVNKRRISPRKTKELYNTASAPGVEQWHEIKKSNDNELLYKFSIKYSVNFHSKLHKIKCLTYSTKIDKISFLINSKLCQKSLKDRELFVYENNILMLKNAFRFTILNKINNSDQTIHKKLFRIYYIILSNKKYTETGLQNTKYFIVIICKLVKDVESSCKKQKNIICKYNTKCHTLQLI